MPDSQLLYDTFKSPAPSSQALGFELISLDMSKRETRVRFDGKAEFANPAGYIQGGFLAAMLDDAIGMLATLQTGARAFPSTIDLNVQYLRPVRIGAVEVLARLRNIGRQVIFAEADLFDSRGKEAARATTSLAINPMKAPVGAARTHKQEIPE